MTESAVAEREEQAPNLPAEREQHPIIAALDARLPEIAEILPDGMRIERFRKVVVQAMLRTPSLWECTPISIITAITEAAEVGIEPTGVLGKGWLIPYKGEAKFIPGWRGFVDLMWRADKILTTVDLVRVGDEFSYRRGTDKYLHHVPDLSEPDREASEDNVTFAYVMVEFPDGRNDFEVMSRAALDKIRTASLAKARDKSKAIWTTNPGEMFKKTPIRRIAKRMPLSPAVQAMLARDEEIDFDTPVERVPDPKRDALRDRISQRTAALRGESSGESEASDSPPSDADRATPAEAPSAGFPSAGGSPRRGDPWMARLHAVGAERGLEHEALSEWAQRIFSVKSLTELDPKQRGQFMARVEALPAAPGTCDHPPAKHIVTATGLECDDCGQTIASRTDQPSAVTREAAAPASEGGAVPAPSSDTTPREQGSRSSTVAPEATAQATAVPPGGGPARAPIEADDSAADEPENTQPAAGSDEKSRSTDPGQSSPAASSYTIDALRTLAAAVLELDATADWKLEALDSTDWSRIFAALKVADDAAYTAWWSKQPREVRQLLMASKQSPKSRRDAALATPDAEQMRAALEGES